MMTVDQDALLSAVAQLIDGKIASALEAAQKGRPIYDKAETPKKPEPKAPAKAIEIGGISVALDSVSKHGTTYARNLRFLIVDEETGEKVWIWGANAAPFNKDDIPDNCQFIASVKA